MKKSLVFIIVLLVSLSYFTETQNTTQQFQQYKQQYSKQYLDHQHVYRFIIYQNNKNSIQKHNQKLHQTYKQGINQFTDRSANQVYQIFSDLYLQAKKLTFQSQKISLKHHQVADIDWVAAGKVTPIADQGQCGASWAFSAVGAVQSLFLIHKDTNLSLSVQEVLDCSQSYGNYGCNGGFMNYTFKFIAQKSIHLTKDYPYTAKNQNCKKITGQNYKIKSFQNGYTCQILNNAIQTGPVSVGVDASNFGSYKSGIITKCGNSPNHGSLVVGMTESYWKLKESFGVKFGEEGYVRIGPGNTCAVCNMVSYPLF